MDTDFQYLEHEILFGMKGKFNNTINYIIFEFITSLINA